MKILFVSAVLPYPLYSGGQIRIYNLLKRLAEKHEIHLYSFIRSDKEKEYLPKLSFCKKVVTIHRGHAWQPKYVFKTLTGSYPFLWNTYHNSEMQSLLSDEIVKGQYDLIHIEPGYVWPSIPTEHKIPIVIAEHNIEHEVYAGFAKQFSVAPLRPFMSLDVAKMAKWEQRSWQQSAGIVAVSEDDKKYISQYSGGKPVTVVPNGVDTKLFAFHPKKNFPEKGMIFLYVGNFLWMENRDAADHIVRDLWPAIKEKYPEATLRIVGKNAPAGQYFIGNVQNIQDELYNADIMLAPIRIGGGTKYKLLESMAAGLPVITSFTGAKGMAGADKKQFLLAESAADVLESIEYLRSDSQRRTLVQNARALVEKDYSWALIASSLDTVWQSAHAGK